MTKIIGKICEKHPDLEGMRYRFEYKPKDGSRPRITTVCIACKLSQNDNWRKVGIKINPNNPNSRNTYQVITLAKRNTAAYRNKQNAYRRKARAKKRGEALVKGLIRLKPSAWMIQWEKDHPGQKLTSEMVVQYVQGLDPDMLEAKRKANAERVRQYRARKDSDGLV